MLVLQHTQRPRDALARRVRHDHVADSAALGGNKRREEANFI